MDLVLLDWFHLPFDPGNCQTDQFFDDEVRRALRESPFREVFVIVERRTEGGAGVEGGQDADSTSARFRVPLQQLLVMERAFATGPFIEEDQRGTLRDMTHLNAVMVDHVSRIQGYGDPVLREGRLFLRYRSADVEISAAGLQVRDYQDFPTPEGEVTQTGERLDVDAETRVAERARAHVFGTGYARPANEPDTWAQ